MEAPDHGISVADDSERGRFAALGNQLIDTHIRLLDALDDLRSGSPPPRELADHCLAFCAAVTRHHTEEDTSVFPVLAARHPELREVLEGLERDHLMVAGMLRRVAELAGDLAGDGARASLDGRAVGARAELDGRAGTARAELDGFAADGARAAPDGLAAEARAELDGLAALLESHFVWEEKRLVAALNALGPNELRPQW
jgi:hypothetical protein